MFLDELVYNDSIENYNLVYGRGTSIKNIKPIDDETYKIFSISNTDIRIVGIKDNYDVLIRTKKIHHYLNTIKKQDLIRAKKYGSKLKDSYFYMIPVQTVKGSVVGYIFKNVFGKKSYASVFKKTTDYVKSTPYMYGFYKDFLTFDNSTTCKPIVVCEGSKDCMYLKQYYPYVLSNNKARVSFNANILRNITNKIIMVYDNDDVGNRNTKLDSNILKKQGFYVQKLQLDEGIKDPASYIKFPELGLNFAKRFKKLIREVEEF